jgi:hypothetical protein
MFSTVKFFKTTVAPVLSRTFLRLLSELIDFQKPVLTSMRQGSRKCDLTNGFECFINIFTLFGFDGDVHLQFDVIVFPGFNLRIKYAVCEFQFSVGIDIRFSCNDFPYPGLGSR